MTQALTAHLWQSTFFALAAAMLTVAFRKNRAQVRYWLWLSASLKFLIPFALLLSFGSYLETWIPAAHQVATHIATPAVSWTVEEFSGPSVSVNMPSADATTSAVDWIPFALLVIWLAGFATVAFTRFRSWLRIRAAVRASAAAGISETVEIRVSPSPLEPGVAGIVRPVILLPDGIVERLTPSELETVLAHELCHVRRRDNLYAAMHMMVEAAFWFHPLVWWIGARFVEERERACDEEVLNQGSHPEVYADAILNVCKLYAQSPLACASGVSGASIRRRVEAIMADRRLPGLNRAKKLLLTAAGIAALAGPITIGLLIGAPAAKQKFEVASVHRCGPNVVEPLREGGGLGDIGPSTNRVTKDCVTVMTLLKDAYVIFADGQNRSPSSIQIPPIEKAPGWLSSDLYTVEGKAEGTPGQPMMLGPMMQSLLEDRFHLKLHKETRTGQAYELTVAKSGSKLKANNGSCGVDVPAASIPKDPATGRPLFSSGHVTPPTEPGVPCRLKLKLRNGPNELFVASALTIDGLVSELSLVTGKTVIDKTGLTGKYDIRLEYLPDDMMSRPNDPAETQPGLFTAIEQQLGLKLTAVTGTRQIIVIDHIDRPTGN